MTKLILEFKGKKWAFDKNINILIRFSEHFKNLLAHTDKNQTLNFFITFKPASEITSQFDISRPN
jgi:hypothetical protein